MSSKSINTIWRVASVLTFGKIRTRTQAFKSNVCLTFDDGPNPQHTPALLDLLKTNDVRASFFVVGTACKKHPELVERIHREGHSIGNHSMSHPSMRELSFREQWQELASMDQFLADQCNLQGMAIRPPRGEVTLPTILYCILHARQLVLWTQDSLDGKFTAEKVIERFRESPVVSGDRLLFHDDAGVANEALSKLLPEWRRKGIHFQTDVRRPTSTQHMKS